MADFDSLFAGFQRHAWRLEVRDTYNVGGQEQDRLTEFLQTGRVPQKTRDNNGWIRTLEAAASRGATIGRVRLVGHPITDYTRFEFAAYRDNAAAGEDIRVIDRRWLDPSWADAPDVWVFDDETAIRMRYNDDGQWLGFETVPVDPFANLRRMITPYAVPLSDYQLDDVPQPRQPATALALPADVAAA